MEQSKGYFLIVLFLVSSGATATKERLRSGSIIGQHRIESTAGDTLLLPTTESEEGVGSEEALSSEEELGSEESSTQKEEKQLLDVYLVPSKNVIGRNADIWISKDGHDYIQLVPEERGIKKISGAHFRIKDNVLYHLKVHLPEEANLWVRVVPEISFILPKDSENHFMNFYGSPITEKERVLYKRQLEKKEIAEIRFMPFKKNSIEKKDDYQELYLVPSPDIVGKYALLRVWQGPNIIDFIPDEAKVKTTEVGTQFLIEGDVSYKLGLPWEKVKMVLIRIPEDHKSASLSKYPKSPYIDFSGYPLKRRPQSSYGKQLNEGKTTVRTFHPLGGN